MRVAWFSTQREKGINGKLLLSSYFTNTVVPELQKSINVDIYGEERHYLTAAKEHKKNPYELFFYQIEDVKDLLFSKVHLGLIPGVVLFHDYFCGTAMPDAMSLSPWQETVFALTGKKAKGSREANLALFSLFSNEWQHGEFLRNNSRIIAESFIKPPQSSYLTIPYKSDIKSRVYSREKPVVAFAGSINIEDRTHKLLQALSSTKTQYQLRWMVSPKEKASVLERLKDYRIKNAEIITDHSVSSWENILSTATVAVHTKRSAYGGLGVLYAISEASGLPILLTDFVEGSFKKSEGLIHIAPGTSEVSQFIEALDSLAELPSDTFFAREIKTPTQTATELINLFQKLNEDAKKFYRAWNVYQNEIDSTLKSRIQMQLGGIRYD